ncbi:MAG: Uma2 family endonuclease [Deltaproteobacteria bacterium]|nr:Uma2 family endonuclease [Deltaproteobacteria bacterium]MBW2353284.1 Uma2 family endonuclease [Deltaproteobacteria bacterium]HDZ91132.1 Uma2 family endonuclease [Deltaproteobacteria bacterium]
MAQAIRKEKRYSYKDYLDWPDDERWELIDGVAYNMSAAPRIIHQNIVSNFHIRLKTHPENRCYTGIAPTDVVFDEYNVVQPDLFVVCDAGKITGDNIQGAPDLIIEVVSPATEVRDRREKKSLYEKFGVMEYLIVFPEREYVERYFLETGTYGPSEILNWDEVLELRSLNIEINLWEIFEKEKSE